VSITAPPPEPSFRSALGDPAIRAVIAVQFVFMTGLGVVFPILVLFARSFGVSFAGAGILISAFGLSRLLGDLAAGPIVDRYGEKPMAAWGMVVLCVCAVLTGAAPNYPLAVFFWAIGGLGSAVTFAAQYSYLLKTVPKRFMARTLGIFYGSFNAGIILGGLFGGLIADRFGISAPFFFYAAILLVALLMQLRFVTPPVSSGSPHPLDTQEALVEREVSAVRKSSRKIAGLFKIPGFTTAIFLNFAYMWMVAAVFDTLLPLFAHDELGVSKTGIGGLFAVVIAAEFLVLYPAGAVADRIGRKPVMVPSLLGLAVITVALGYSTSVGVLVVMLFILGLMSGTSGVPPAAILSDVVPEDGAGTGVGIFRFAGDLSFFIAPIVAGAAAEGLGFEGAYWICAVPLVVALVMMIRTPETLQARLG
jgi:MFS family permease